MNEREAQLRSDAGPGGEELAEELASKVLAASAAFAGPNTGVGFAVARLTATVIDKQVDLEDE